MALLKYEGGRVSGLAAAVPRRVVRNRDLTALFPEKEIAATVKMTGIEERRAADDSTCASDLCFAAAQDLIAEMGIDRAEIDVLIFVSQTPDYRMPATGVILQDRLGLPKTTAAFDVNLGCSGYIYGLSLACSYAAQSGVRRVLLLNGETRTKAYSFRDKKTGLLFGDAGSATLVDQAPGAPPSFFSLNSDGSGSQAIMIKAGGYRYPSSPETVRERTYEDGSVRTEEQGVMDGAAVFTFALREVPGDLQRVLAFAGATVDQCDYVIFHQANRYMTDHLARKIGAPAAKVPYALHRFGNTSSVSIPLTMASELREPLRSGAKRLLMSGFGVGLSWGSALLSVGPCAMPPIREIP